MILHGLGVAIPSDRIARFLRREEQRHALGMVVRPVPAPGSGTRLLILEVTPGSPAETASLLVGDIVVRVNGEPIRSIDDLPNALENASGTVILRFIRGGQGPERQVVARLREWRTEAA
jgi:S1-C subfamily serine protease